MKLIDADILMNDIENGIKAGNHEEGYENYPHINNMDDIIETIKYADSVKQEPKTDILDKIMAEINTSNRGTCDYYIVDRIEEIIKDYKNE